MDDKNILIQHSFESRRRLRVAVVTETYPPEVNGVAMSIQRMIFGLQQRHHHVQLVRPRQNHAERPTITPNFAEILQRGVRIPRYESLKFGLPAKHALMRLWSSTRPDIVHLVTEGPLGWSALKAALQLQIPISSDFHTNFDSYSKHYGCAWLRGPITSYLRRFHNQADCTLVPTKGMAADLRKNRYCNLRVVARGVDTQLFDPAKRSSALRERWGVEPQQPVALYVGRIAAEKNLPVVMQAFAAMKTERPDIKLVLVGDGPQRAGLEGRHPDCIFAGMRIGEDLAAHYASADVFLFPSLTETYGNVTVEAMASGLAVVAYGYAAADEHIKHGHNGLLADFANAEDFVQLARGLAHDMQRISAMGRQARITAEGIAWDEVNDQFEAALRDVIAAGNGMDDARTLTRLLAAQDS